MMFPVVDEDVKIKPHNYYSASGSEVDIIDSDDHYNDTGVDLVTSSWKMVIVRLISHNFLPR